jgi:hypothetical protein
MTGRPVAAVGTMLLLVLVTVLVARAGARDAFPHREHAGLFPLCIGCHAGIPEGNEAEYYPDPASCLSCHDGERVAPVVWTGPARPITNLRFEHVAHGAHLAAEGQVLDCSECHTQPGADRMAVERGVPQRCFGCHTHQAMDHFVDAECATCHLPLAQTRLPLARMIDFPVPVTHEHAAFLAELHGELAAAEPATCATCHTRDQCASCHVDVPGVPVLAQIPAAPQGMTVPAQRAEYPLPASHREPGWLERHGTAAVTGSCSTCHTRESCTSCHEVTPPRAPTRAVLGLPSRREVAAPGVLTVRRAPESHASPFFATQHGAVAAGRPASCATCHNPARFCQACHEPFAAAANGPEPGGAVRLASREGAGFAGALRTPAAAAAAAAGSAPAARARVDTIPIPPTAAAAARSRSTAVRGPVAFHPANYLLRHAPEAYNRRLDCSNCHDARVFCRDCHEQAGFGAVGRLNRGFHDAQPLWLLRHGQAARQTLESCTACHAQRDCMQCHSTIGAFRVNPHGPGFDAAAAQRRNARVCFACHLADPVRRMP